jgi:4-hydroxy-3-polyprenylbenzoate decarboxylase
VHADADFCLVGTVDPGARKPEGPFGDHLGYYSLVHDFPVLKVRQVYHREDAVWPFTVVGRPPQEDTAFGALIHELTGPVIPTVLPGVKAVHAVDATGVHPLLLAIGSERYVPYARPDEPQELLTQANAILGQGQLSLAKYLFIVAADDAPDLSIEDIPAFFRHLLERVHLGRDLHFQTRTTIDTLDYSGGGLNQGSKLVLAAAGKPRRTLGTTLPPDLRLPEGFRAPRICLPGVLAVTARAFQPAAGDEVARATALLGQQPALDAFPLVVLCDDSEFCARSIENFLWVTFTRSNPAADVRGGGERIVDKHWGCQGPLVIDARIKPYHAPPLEEDPEVSRRVDRLFQRGAPLGGLE